MSSFQLLIRRDFPRGFKIVLIDSFGSVKSSNWAKSKGEALSIARAVQAEYQRRTGHILPIREVRSQQGITEIRKEWGLENSR